MKLSAYPFDAQTGELLPVYHYAYLRGDLAATASQLAVTHYLRYEATAVHTHPVAF
jgi:hypothetical protein